MVPKECVENKTCNNEKRKLPNSMSGTKRGEYMKEMQNKH